MLANVHIIHTFSLVIYSSPRRLSWFTLWKKCNLHLNTTENAFYDLLFINLQIELISIFELFRSTLCSWYCQVPYFMIYNFSLFLIIFLKYVTTQQTSLFIVTSGDSPNLTMAGPKLIEFNFITITRFETLKSLKSL